jgi:hypothetical protein
VQALLHASTLAVATAALEQFANDQDGDVG